MSEQKKLSPLQQQRVDQMTSFFEQVERRVFDEYNGGGCSFRQFDAEDDSWKRHDNLGIFASQLVLQTLREVFVFEHQAMKWMNGNLIDKNMEVNAGAANYAYQEVNRTGRAKVRADGADDIPFATIEGRNNILDIAPIKIGIFYTQEELQRARFQNTIDVVSNKVAAAREGHDRTLNDYIREGIPGKAIYGMTNIPGIYKADALTPNWADPATTPTQIIDSFTAAYNAQVDLTDEIERGTHVVMPIATKQALATKRTNPGFNDDSVLETLGKLFPNVQTWESEYGMRDAGANGGSALLIYRKETNRVRAMFPEMMVPRAPFIRHGKTEIVFNTRFGGVMSPRPRSVFLLSGV